MLESIWNKSKEVYEVVCNECGKVVAEYDEEYAKEYPNSCEKWLDEYELHHNSYECTPEVQEKYTHEIICDKCGEVLGECSLEYMQNNPSGYDMWKEQVLTEHEIYCPESEYQPWDETLLKGKSHFDKEWELIVHHSWFCSSGTIYEQENYYIRWGTGGIDSNDIDIILEEWSIALIEITKRIYKELNLNQDKIMLYDLLASIPDEIAAVIEYELRMKNLLNKEYKVKWYGELMRFEKYRVVKEVIEEEIIEEA